MGWAQRVKTHKPKTEQVHDALVWNSMWGPRHVKRVKAKGKANVKREKRLKQQLRKQGA